MHMLSQIPRSAFRRATRSVHSSAVVSYPRRAPVVTQRPSEAAIAEGLEDLVGKELPFVQPKWGAADMEEFRDDDTTAAGHIWIQQQRQVLHYLRLIEHEMPQLVAFRKPFVPPTSAEPIAVRSISYGGEEHPATVKRAIVVPVSRLPLKDKHAVYKFRLLAGVRWTPQAPKDSGLTSEGGKDGYIKISCEDFPRPAMNLKWASDTLDKLIDEANNGKDRFTDIPFDRRHLDAKARKAQKGKLVRDMAGGRGRYSSPPSIRDFPKSWLPKVEKSSQPQEAVSAPSPYPSAQI